MHATDYQVGASVLQQQYKIEQSRKQLQFDQNVYSWANTNRTNIWSPTKEVPTNGAKLITSDDNLYGEEQEENKKNVRKRAASKLFCCRNCKVFLIGLLIGLLIAGIALGTAMTMWLDSTASTNATFSTTTTSTTTTTATTSTTSSTTTTTITTSTTSSTSTTTTTITTSTTSSTSTTTTTITTSTTSSTSTTTTSTVTTATTSSTSTTTTSTVTTATTSSTTTTTTVTTTVTTDTTATTGSNFTPSSATCSSTVATSCTTTTSIVASCQSYEVSWNNHCYYLDGSSGNCAAGYSLATNAVMTCISTQFAGKTYQSTVSGNCCLWTADTYECYGLGSGCNAAGPFTSGPTLGGSGCSNAQNNFAQQLTFCGSI